MSFFMKSRKRKTGGAAAKTKEPYKKDKMKSALSENIDSESDVDSIEGKDRQDKFYSSDDEEEETAQQKKLRLAKEYLAKIEAEEEEKKDEEETLKDAVSSRLIHDISEQAGKLIKDVADSCIHPTEADLRIFRGHHSPVTSIVISPDDIFVFTAGKDCNICKWNVETGLKVKTIKGGRKGTEDTHVGHTNYILCLAISSDGKYLAAGDLNFYVKLWNPDDCSFIHKFKGHRGPVTGVAFQVGTHTLFTCSDDKAVKVWNVDELSYVETLFGHNSPVTGIDSLTKARAITSGGRDKSVHVWKIMEDSQLLFHGHESSIDCVSMINEGNFITGGDDNAICLWSVMKKKPLCTKKQAHGIVNGSVHEHWISSVSAMRYSDVVASGSGDGFIRVWKCRPDVRSLTPLFTVPVKGFINSLRFSNNGDFLVAGVGQEHRLGRWWRTKEAKNGWVYIPLRKKES